MPKPRNGDRHKGEKVQTWTETKLVWQAAADAEGMTLSAWLRRAADRAMNAEMVARFQATAKERASQ